MRIVGVVTQSATRLAFGQEANVQWGTTVQIGKEVKIQLGRIRSNSFGLYFLTSNNIAGEFLQF
jgi:hypothetical protein